jgi:hypothetical protein
MVYIDPSGELVWFVPVIVGAIIGAYIGGAAANGWEYNPTQWGWDEKTWGGIGVGAIFGAIGGCGFYYAQPYVYSALKSWLPTFSSASLTQVSYVITGFAAGGVIGYLAGFTGGMIYSKGNWDYAHKSGILGAKIGATIGSIVGAIGADIENYKKPANSNSSLSKDNQAAVLNNGSYSNQFIGGNYINRPDDDGYLTLSEANYWYRYGNGQPLYVDLSKINLSGISTRDFSGIGASKSFDLFSPRYFRNLNDALVYGSITLTLKKGNVVTATFGYDIYNFDIKPWRFSTLKRNIFTIIGSLYAGFGKPYKIYFYGSGYVNP